MKPKFKAGDYLHEFCGCRSRVVSVGRKYYTMFNLEDGKKWKYKYEIKRADQECELLKEKPMKKRGCASGRRL